MPGTPLSWMAMVSLIVLVLQNSILVVMTRYSRVNVAPEERYHTSTLVLNQEIVKMVFCMILFALENRRHMPPDILEPRKNLFSPPVLHVEDDPGLMKLLWNVIYQRETLKIAVPAALFTLQNYLLFVGLANLDAVTFQVWSQTKLLSSAIFSVLLLGRRLGAVQWGALLLLTCGVLLTQQEGSDPTRTSAPTGERPSAQRSLLGISACVLSGLSSSYAGVYFERVVKTTAPSLAVRNIHLSLFGIPFAGVSLFVLDVLPCWEKGVRFGFWRGYDQWLTMGLVLVHAIGGLLVAVVVKYADNIVKGFATGVAVVFSGFLSFIIWGYIPGSHFVLGCILITAATVLYHKFDKKS